MALTIADHGGGSLGTPPPSFTAGTACAVGDAIVVCALLFNANTNTFTFSDNVNTGNYTNLGTQLRDVTSGTSIQCAWIRCNAAGTPTVSVALGTSVIGKIYYVRISGFTGTATADAGMSSNFVAASSTTVAMSPPNTAFNNEAAILFWKASQNLSATPSGWTAQTAQEIYSLIAATSGTSTAFNGTLTAAGTQDASVVGIYDATGPSVTSVNGGSAMAEGATGVAVVGTGFASGMTSNILQPGGVSVAQTTTFNSATSASINLVVEPGTGSQLAFTDATYTTTYTVTAGGQTSTAVSVTVQPPAGLIFQTLSSVNTTSAYRITATPDLVAGDQLEAAGNAAGTAAVPTGLQLNNDGTWQFANGDTAQNFYVRAYDSVNKVWGPYALQSTTITRRGRMLPGFILGGLL